jgi:hypothetical protein
VSFLVEGEYRRELAETDIPTGRGDGRSDGRSGPLLPVLRALGELGEKLSASYLTIGAKAYAEVEILVPVVARARIQDRRGATSDENCVHGASGIEVIALLEQCPDAQAWMNIVS